MLLACLAALPAVARAQLAPDEDRGPAPVPVQAEVDPRVERALQSEERTGVFLMLQASDRETDAAQQSVLDALGGEFEVWHRYRSIPALSGGLTRAGLAQARVLQNVNAVQLDSPGTGGLKEALPAVGVDRLHKDRGLNGRGVTVAVLDTGTTTRHPALQDAIVAQKCFTSRACPPSNAPQGDSAEDDHNHGSNVTGIIASRGGGGAAVGYAPGVNVVAVKVLNSNNAGRASDWVAGFDWVYSNLSTLKVKVINASLCTIAQYSSTAECDRQEGALAAITKKLIAAGVTITASSGNEGRTETMSAPACNSGVIAVGATYDKDLGRQPEQGGTYRALGGPSWPACSDATTNRTTLACFTSTGGTRLDLLAPGSQLVSLGRGTSLSMFRGTSQAAPGVAGVAALMLECNQELSPARMLEVLKMTGEPIKDPRTGLSYPLIRPVEALAMVCPVNAPAGGASGSTSGAGGATAGTPPVAGQSGVISEPGAAPPPAVPPTAAQPQPTPVAAGAAAPATSGSNGTQGGVGAAGQSPGSTPPSSAQASAVSVTSGGCAIEHDPGRQRGARGLGLAAVCLGLAWLSRRKLRGTPR